MVQAIGITSTMEFALSDPLFLPVRYCDIITLGSEVVYIYNTYVPYRTIIFSIPI